MMTQSETATTSHTTSVVTRVLLGFLALTEAVIGVWALFAPASFYRSFPAGMGLHAAAVQRALDH
jgi:hypothetical protein